MSNLEFAWPYAALSALFLLPLWFFEKRRGRDHSFLQGPQTVALKGLIKGHIKASFRSQHNWLLTIVWLLMVIALMRPQYVGRPIEISRDGRNIMLVVDISESMEAGDMHIDQKTVDRLTAAKNVMFDFIDHRRGDRIGLVVFGSESFLHAPLSFDHPTIKQFLADAQIGFAGPKTAIGDALGLSVKKLIEHTEGDKTVILITDGENNAGAIEPLKAAEIAKKHGVKVYVVGLGSSRMVVDGFFGPTAINPSLSLDQAEPDLKEIASLTGGKYFRAKEHDALLEIYRDIDKLEPVKSDPIVLIPRKELFYFVLMAVLLLLFIKAMVLYMRLREVRAPNLAAPSSLRSRT